VQFAPLPVGDRSPRQNEAAHWDVLCDPGMRPYLINLFPSVLLGVAIREETHGCGRCITDRSDSALRLTHRSVSGSRASSHGRGPSRRRRCSRRPVVVPGTKKGRRKKTMCVLEVQPDVNAARGLSPTAQIKNYATNIGSSRRPSQGRRRFRGAV
jgi:hypothetical protein